MADTAWGALVPVDGDLIAVTFQNNASGPTLSGWIWMYADGLSMLGATQATVGWSLETTRLPNPTHAGGGPGVVSQATPYVLGVGDTLPRVDPGLTTSNGSQTNQGVNQWVVAATDNAATVLPIACQITYAPLYLEPR